MAQPNKKCEKHRLQLKSKNVHRTATDPEIISPLGHAVGLRYLRLEHGHVAHGRCQTGDGLAPAAPDSDKKCVSSWLLQHTADTGQVLQDIAKGHRIVSTELEVAHLPSKGFVKKNTTVISWDE